MALPSNPIGLYWDSDGANWPASNRVRLINIPSTYNVIFLAFAIPVGGSPGTNGALSYTTPIGAAGTNLNADIAACRLRGQKIILSCGGGGNHVTLGSMVRADNFVQSIKDINVQLGGSGTTNVIDGIDFNIFEGTTADGTWMSYIGKKLKGYYGTGFLITSPPGGGIFGGQHATDRLALVEMYANGVLDWVCPQLYDGEGQSTIGNARNSLGYWNTAVGITSGTYTIPKNRIGLGVGILQTDSNYWRAVDVASTYIQLVSEGYAPKGVMNWAASLDTILIASTVAPIVTNNLNAQMYGVTSMRGVNNISF